MAPRFFVDSEFTPDNTIVLPEKPAHHASRVLRMREGDSATLFDGKGNEAAVTLHFFSDRTEAKIHSVHKSQTESPLKTVLIQSLVSQEKLDWILEKATELGVSKIAVVTQSYKNDYNECKLLCESMDRFAPDLDHLIFVNDIRTDYLKFSLTDGNYLRHHRMLSTWLIFDMPIHIA